MENKEKVKIHRYEGVNYLIDRNIVYKRVKKEITEKGINNISVAKDVARYRVVEKLEKELEKKLGRNELEKILGRKIIKEYEKVEEIFEKKTFEGKKLEEEVKILKEILKWEKLEEKLGRETLEKILNRKTLEETLATSVDTITRKLEPSGGMFTEPDIRGIHKLYKIPYRDLAIRISNETSDLKNVSLTYYLETFCPYDQKCPGYDSIVNFTASEEREVLRNEMRKIFE